MPGGSKTVTIQDLGSIGEFVGAIATIVTLIYLALQIRQNTQSVRMSAEMDLSNQFADWCGHVVDDPNLGRIWDAASTEPDTLTDDEKRTYLWYVAQLFSYYEGLFRLFAKGHITEDTWEAKADWMLVILKQRLVDIWWRSRMAPFSNDFFEYIESRRASVNVSATHKNVIETLKQTPPNRSLDPEA